MTGPPTRLMLRQKSSSGSTSEKHPSQSSTARTRGTTVGHSQSAKSTMTQTACADLSAHEDAPAHRGVFVASGVVSGASQEATELDPALLGEFRPARDEFRGQCIEVVSGLFPYLLIGAEDDDRHGWRLQVQLADLQLAADPDSRHLAIGHPLTDRDRVTVVRPAARACRTGARVSMEPASETSRSSMSCLVCPRFWYFI